MGSHFHQGGVIYALGRNDWGSHFPGGVIRDFDTGKDGHSNSSNASRYCMAKVTVDFPSNFREYIRGAWQVLE